MKIGISTASLYPMHTEDALFETAKLGIKNVEIFLNSVSELRGEIFSYVKSTIREYGLNVISVHPFSTPLETLFLFSSYDRRVDEIMDLYKSYFEIMNEIGAKIFVIHGAIASTKCSDERYAERFALLSEAGQGFGITVAQENVSYCKSGKLEFLEMLKAQLGDSAKFVLDIKQARRSGIEPSKIIEKIGSNIVHLHLSDGELERDCLPIGGGSFDFISFFRNLAKVGYKGGAVVELYRENYGDYSELKNCVEILEKLFEKSCI